jgi:hypothetical protein
MAGWLLRKLGMNALVAVVVFAMGGGALGARAVLNEHPGDDADLVADEDDDAEEGEGGAPENGAEGENEPGEDGDDGDAEEGVENEPADGEGEEDVLTDEQDDGALTVGAACEGVEDDVDGLPFGCYRAYQVRQACGDLEGEEREACEEDLGPAWMHPRHPAFGEDGKHADRRPGEGRRAQKGGGGDAGAQDSDGQPNQRPSGGQGGSAAKETGPPEHAGPKDNAGPKADAGPKANAGGKANAGPPSHAGPPPHAGPKANAGPPGRGGKGR